MSLLDDNFTRPKVNDLACILTSNYAPVFQDDIIPFLNVSEHASRTHIGLFPGPLSRPEGMARSEVAVCEDVDAIGLG